MRKNGNSRGAPPAGGKAGGKNSSLVAAVLFGMVLGLVLAGGVAWYILKRPSPFQNNAQRDAVKLEPVPPKPAPAPVAQAAPDAASGVGAASGVADGKPRFEFYKVLTDKQDGAPQTTAKAADKAPKVPYFLQAGAFSNAGDADKLKAKLAMMGMEASVQAATLPDKTVWHRVRLGPYKTEEEMNKASALLKQNGVHVTPSHAQ